MTKTTIEINEVTLKQAKSVAAIRGISLSQLVAELLDEFVVMREAKVHDKPWMIGFGELADLVDENRRILKLIDDEFGIVDENDCR